MKLAGMIKLLSAVLLVCMVAFSSCRDMFKPQSMRAGDSSVKAIADFTGDWYWESADTTKSFKINLIKLNDSVYGQYCAAYDKGNRLDCEFNTSYNMFGHKMGDSIVLNFKTFYGAKNGQAVLRHSGKSLSWRISHMPEGGDCFAPGNATMYKSIKNW